jgi:hypothetical protein
MFFRPSCFTFCNSLKRVLFIKLMITFDCLNANWDGENLHANMVKANKIKDI